MSNHFTGLSLGPPLGDQRLDLCDLYAFQAPGDSSRTVLILNANPNADALHPDAVYRLNIDNDGDNLTDIAFSWVFSSPASDGSQTYSFFNTDDTKVEYNASEPVNDRERWTDQFVHLLGHTGGYSREEAIAAIDKHGLLPDVLRFDPSKPAAYPNGRTFTEDVIDIRVAFLTKNEAPPTGLQPHTDTLDRFPYLGDPHPAAT